MSKITESEIEKFAIELLGKQSYQYIYASDIASALSACLPVRVRTQTGDVQTGSETPTRKTQ
jgi:hypothetical protein